MMQIKQERSLFKKL